MAKRKTKRSAPIAVSVTEGDIQIGVGGDCFHCAAALALQRATGDDHANVYERDYVTYLEAWSRSIVCPIDVRGFIWAFDHLPRGAGELPIVPEPIPEELKPFDFTLPPQDDAEWKERCYGCEELFPAKELDDEGCCPECKGDN